MKLFIEDWINSQQFEKEINILFEESFICYKAGAFRASFVFSYICFKDSIKMCEFEIVKIVELFA